MFDKKKVQIDMLKAMFDSKTKMRKCDMEDSVIISIDGLTAFILDKSDVMIDLSKISDCSQLKDYFNAKNNVSVRDTGLEKRELGRTIVKLHSDENDLSVYVQKPFLDKFNGGVFYGSNKTSPVIVKDGIGNVCGLIMPIRTSDF